MHAVWGVTLDCGYRPGVDGRPGLRELNRKIDAIVESLSSMEKKTTVRVVFDEAARADAYRPALRRLKSVAFVMGELLDSSHLADFTPTRYRARADEYFDALSGLVDIWEIGNEVNGDWTSLKKSSDGRKDVAESIAAAYDEAKLRNLTTALTFYKDLAPPRGGEHPPYELFRWVSENLPTRVQSGIDYALLSYYNSPHAIAWESYFVKMATTFPNARVGFGEMGGGDAHDDRLDTVAALYGLALPVSRYAGGYFYWYFCADGVPKGSDIWHAINRKIARGK